MGWKSKAVSILAKKVRRELDKNKHNAVHDQNKWRKNLVHNALNTAFGKDHGFSSIGDYNSFKQHVPIIEYEAMRPYIDRIIAGEKNVLWPGTPKYFGKTSGTTSGVKYIPISHQSIKPHITAARNAIFCYTLQSGNPVFDGKLIFLSGSPALNKKGGVLTGRLSGIVNHEIPAWIKPGQLPTYTTNCIEDWEEKLELIVAETYNKDLRLISGIPPWVQMYYERLLDYTGKKTIKEIFPNLSLFVHGGVNYEPYRATMNALHGQGVDTLETYPASEGFIAFQDDYMDDSLLLNTNAGMFFEFVPLSELSTGNPKRLSLDQVSTDIDYAIIINSNAGLWGYSIGDTVRFSSLDPYRLRVSGRVKHFISAFGEHVIAKEVEEALTIAIAEHGGKVAEFTVAPQVHPAKEELPYHEWLIDFETLPTDMKAFQETLDAAMRAQNIYYDDLITGNILQPAVLTQLAKGAFRSYMASIGKLGGQNKVPRLKNDRDIADRLNRLVSK